MNKPTWQCMDCAANSDTIPSSTAHQIVTSHVIGVPA